MEAMGEDGRPTERRPGRGVGHRAAPWLSFGALGALAVLRAASSKLARWGAIDEEAAGPMPGDALVADPVAEATRAVTVDVAPEALWPWVAQLGADRGGFYSYTWLENLFGLGIRNADRVVASWQERRPGDLVAATAHGRAGWVVVEVRPPEALVLLMADPATGRPRRRDRRPGFEFSWAFAVRPAGPGSSRLVVRERAGFSGALAAAAMEPVGLVSFVMTRKMLLGIKARAEAAARAPWPQAGAGSPSATTATETTGRLSRKKSTPGPMSAKGSG
jgi:hypothetical protein